MINRGAILILSVFLIPAILAQCNETQININSASVEELDNLTGVGPAIAQNIINSRPFSSVDDLLNVSRIGNKTLEKIKQQGLACVVSENGINASEEILPKNNSSEEQNLSDTEVPDYIASSSAPKSPIVRDIISLNPNDSKSIKSNENPWSSDKIAVYGFIAFSVMIIALFVMRMKKNRKTEFEK